MLDIIQTANELIEQGKKLNDQQLINMGTNILNSYKEKDNNNKKYVCENCEYTFEYDKPNRKRCPKCKKNKLILRITKLKKDNNTENFKKQIRQKDTSRIKYDENGNPIGTIAKSEPVLKVENKWTDNLTECFDKDNEILKQHSTISPRNRRGIKYVEVICDECKNKFSVHPVHVAGRSKYVCDRCVSRKGRI